MKIIVFGVAPWIRTAYGKNTRFILSALSPKHELTVVTYYGLQGASIQMGDISIHPIYEPLPYSAPSLAYWAKVEEAALIIQHFDIWLMPKNWIMEHALPVVTYSPVDSTPLSNRIIQGCEGAITNVAMSKFAQRQYEAHNMPTHYIPHQVDLNIYKPQDKQASREVFSLPQDKFIFGSVATNLGPRKNIPGLLRAYKQFLDSVPSAKADTLLYLHTYMHRDHANVEGYNIPEMVAHLNISDNISITDPMQYLTGLSEEAMCALYNAIDVHVLPSFGEGFGMPIIEAQACGTPTIASDNSAITEVISDAGILVPCNDAIAWQRYMSWQGIPSHEHLTQALQTIYNNPTLLDTLKTRALTNAKRYAADKIAKEWQRFVEEL